MSAARCYRPKDHPGACGEPLTDQEDEARILWGSCGAAPAPRGILVAKDGYVISDQVKERLLLDRLTRRLNPRRGPS